MKKIVGSINLVTWELIAKSQKANKNYQDKIYYNNSEKHFIQEKKT